jgi:hypothetical protein
MKDELDVAVALGLPVDSSRYLAGIDEFGRTAAYAETCYDAALATALFLNQDQPRPLEEYEQCGREAIQLLVTENDPDSYRRQPAIDNDLWARMKASGQPGFPALFPGLNPVQVAVITADYSVIVWWAQAMRTTGEALAAMRAFLAANPGANLNGADFQALRQKLAGRLTAVAANTKKEFGEPWGLVAMDRVSGRSAAAEWRVLGPRLTLALERPAQALSGSSVSNGR